MLASNMYLNRHNKIGAYIHWVILKDLGAEVTEQWYNHVPKTSTEVSNHSIMWDMQILTDARLSHNRPDIVVHNREKKTCLMIDVAVPQDRNVIKTTAEKIRRYRDLEIEVQQCWNLNSVRAIPVVVGALGTVNKNITPYLNAISEKIEFKIVQNIALMGTQRILRNVLRPDVKKQL